MRFRHSLCILLIMLAGRSGFSQGFKKDTVRRLKQATVFIQVKTRDYLSGRKIGSSGSGFFVHRNGYLITNWHVVSGFGAGPLRKPRQSLGIKVFVNSGKLDEKVLQATVVVVDKEKDLAILATGKKTANFLELGDTTELFETCPVWVLGFPLGERFAIIERGPEITISRGSVTALRHDDQDNLRIIQTDAQFDSGNSGGPLVGADGKVVGIAQSIIVQNRSLNFAIPAGYAAALMKTTALDKPWKATGKVTFSSEPAGAELYVDGKRIGKLGKHGLRAEVPLGFRQITLVHSDFLPSIQVLSLKEGDKLRTKLQKAKPLRIFVKPFKLKAKEPAKKEEKKKPAAKTKTKPGKAIALALPKKGQKLLEELFGKRDILRQMDQATGGMKVHTWYVRDGKLHQHESNGLLHAIYMGKPKWRDYAFAAKVEIKNERNDSRAGLIFRETPKGFYLFRIHRESDKAQLAYHCKSPFGWFILGEKTLGVDITGTVNQMEVYAQGQNITCMLNHKPVFQVRDQLADRGRIGFYSVESRASFDNAVVARVTGGQTNQNMPDSYQMFWFTDTFNTKSNWWVSRFAAGKLAEPWLFSDGGAVFMNDDERLRLTMMDKYVLTNFLGDLIVQLGPGKQKGDSQFGLVFGRRQDGKVELDYRVVISSKSRKCRLFMRRGNKLTLLKEEPLPSAEPALMMPELPSDVIVTGQPGVWLFGAPISRLFLLVNGPVIDFGTPRRRLLRYEFEDKAVVTEGKFGILSKGVKLILHRLTIANPDPRPLGWPVPGTKKAEKAPPSLPWFRLKPKR